MHDTPCNPPTTQPQSDVIGYRATESAENLKTQHNQLQKSTSRRNKIGIQLEYANESVIVYQTEQF